MSVYGDDILVEYVLDALPADEASEVEATARGSAGLQRRIAELSDLLGAMPAGLEAVAPSPGLRERILADAATTNRFERFAQRVAELLDLAVDKARSLLARIDDPTSWVPGFEEGISLYHLEGGPALRNAVVGFVRIKAGQRFPHHRHIGEEIVFILQGVSTDTDGTVSGPGDEIRKRSGTEHDFGTHADAPDYVYLAIVHEGVQIGDLVFGPDDPDF